MSEENQTGLSGESIFALKLLEPGKFIFSGLAIISLTAAITVFGSVLADPAVLGPHYGFYWTTNLLWSGLVFGGFWACAEVVRMIVMAARPTLATLIAFSYTGFAGMAGFKSMYHAEEVFNKLSAAICRANPALLGC